MKKQSPPVPIEHIRHSLAHLLAHAVQEQFPGAKFAIGPVIEHGFYYDFLLPRPVTEQDLPALEKRMRALVKEGLPFTKLAPVAAEAKASLKDQPYKQELIDDLKKEKAAVTFYQVGGFTDLCRGGHVENTHDIPVDAFALDSIAGAYWRGSEKNDMLTRIYGLAFATKQELRDHLAQRKEAEARDHRKLGAKLGIYMMSDLVGPGLPLWLPNGAVMIEELERLAKETEDRAGYLRVRTPHIAKEDLYKLSGHLPYYAESMFPPMELPIEEEKKEMVQVSREMMEHFNVDVLPDLEKIFPELHDSTPSWSKLMERLRGLPSSEKDGIGQIAIQKLLLDAVVAKHPREKYYLKAMNCPHTHLIYAHQPRSYRDLPVRLAEYGTVYRYEKSGELFGLMRVRTMQMNDAHLYVTPEQFADEFNAVNQMYLEYFKRFGFTKYVMRFSTHDPKELGKKYVDEPKLWTQTESMVRDVLTKSKIPFVEVPNEAAFYGPKIDVEVWSSIGREFTIATNQVDFAQPRRFGLVYTDADGKEKTPICIHRAPLGTHERFIGFLIEHYGGAFPTWLAPVQVHVIPVAARHIEAAEAFGARLRTAKIRTMVASANETVGKKIRAAQTQHVPYMLVLGDKEIDAETVTVRARGSEEQKTMTPEDFLDAIRTEIEERR